MSTISNERLEKLSEYDCADRYEVMSMATELLALRKERERAEPVGEVVLGSRDEEGNYPHAHVICLAGEGCADWDNFPDGFKLYTAPPAPAAQPARAVPVSWDGMPFTREQLEGMHGADFATGYVRGWERKCASVEMKGPLYTAPPVPDERYQQLSELYHAQEKRLFKLAQRIKGPTFDKYAHSSSQAIDVLEAAVFGETDKPKSEMSQQAEQLLRDTTALAVTLSGETDTTSQQFESLAGKAVGRSDGFEYTPVADLYELLTKCGECYDYTTSAKVAADWIKEGYSAREYVKLDRLQEAMTQGSTGEGDGWIPCSERMPVEKDIVLVVDDGYFVCEAQYREGDFFSAVRGNNEFFETTCRDVEFWQPLPEPPCK
ncbi:DUF551 domain-containing protein [Cronobacter malonaticus]|uniref:DUF551 domain-containing protein n=1 Tax=Cronobacter malonaticus TaxID=413503 RepID=UPI002895B224|nr:DUF551 domain-containing protein [Cronobacter malonaticus]MDT3563818.1 DUF551 domain-containing protein [Cronobacter malonaticus]